MTIRAAIDGRGNIYGESAPLPGQGRIGDIYIDTVANLEYGPKTVTGWGSGRTTLGPRGIDGWTRVTRYVPRDDDIVEQIIDWTGGEGTKPAVNVYVGGSGATGYVVNIVDAANVRGPAGSLDGIDDQTDAAALDFADGVPVTQEGAPRRTTAGAVAAMGLLSFDDKEQAEGKSIPTAIVKSIYLRGHESAGDKGGAHYRFVEDEPDHDLWLQTQDGGFWEIDEPVISPAMADGDASGSVDAGPAFNKILDYLRAKSRTLASGTFVTPVVIDGAGGIYSIETSINMTALRMFSVVFRNMILIGKCTGKAVCDLTHSRFTKWDNVTIWGDITNKPATAIMMARSATAQSADCHEFSGLTINGYFTRAALHNYASETNTFTHARIWNYESGVPCIIIDGEGDWGEQSDYSTMATGAQSCLENLFVQGDFRQLTSGAPIKLRLCPHVEFQNSYGVSFDDVIVDAYCDNARLSHWKLDLHVEAGADCKGLMRVNSTTGNASFDNFYYSDNRPNGTDQIFVIDESVDFLVFYSITVKIGDWYDSTAPVNGLFDRPEVITVRGGDFHLPSLTGLNKLSSFISFAGDLNVGAARTYTSGKTFYSDRDDATGGTLQFYQNSVSPAASDQIFSWQWLANNNVGAAIIYGQLGCLITDPTSGSEDGVPQMTVRVNGSLVTTFQWTGAFTETLVPFRLPTYTIAQLLDGVTLPPASCPRSIVYVSNGASNKLIAVSSGGAWRYMDGVALT